MTAKLGDLRFLLAELARQADEGDDTAATRLNQLAPQCAPAVLMAADEINRAKASAPAPLPRTFGDILAAAPNSSGGPDFWDAITAAVDLIACHYSFDTGDIWEVVFELEVSCAEANGHHAFGHLLERPWGFTCLGRRVAQNILGADVEESLPLISLSYH